MEKYSVKKTFYISYGHRLMDYKGKCGNLHGHNAKIEITVESEELDDKDMALDFTELGARAEKWLDGNLDHKTILCAGDPLAKTLENSGQELFLTEKNPTAEILAKTILEAIRALGVKAKKVRFWETDDSSATYKKGD